jgi:SP family general alpha glucoside:H+ symporter-like MFS transporter
MESFDMFLVGNFVALPAFKERFGIQLDGKWVIETKWQSALFQAGQCGAFVGVFAAGPVTNRLGYKWTTFCALVAMICTIFISFFVSLITVSGNIKLIDRQLRSLS